MGLWLEVKDGVESQGGRQNEDWLLNLLQIAAAAIVSFLFFFFISPKHPATGGAVSVCLIGAAMAARACWDQRHHLWFWLTLVAISILQGMAIILVPWPETRFPGAVLLPIGLADFAAVYGILRFIERRRSTVTARKQMR